MIRRLLVANRGEIAVRVLRTARRLGIETVLTVSQADRSSMAARLADLAVVIGPGPAAASYLSVDAVMSAAHAHRVDAVHPGYGFLSESPALAQACQDAGVVFVGPTAAQLREVGDKVRARANAEAAGLPVVPGRPVDGVADLVAAADEVGVPLLLKAVGGGGGRGMRVLASVDRAGETLDLAVAEAQAAFGDPRVYVERYVERSRHVEVQVLGDGREAIHLGTRDCSTQRRHQKVIEEAPAPLLTEAATRRMCDGAVALARHLGYRGLGTVEYLYDIDAGQHYFLEMNARIQVEHPVTEQVCGLDLVAEQLAVADGQALRVRQDEVRLAGHAVECRINAEDPAADFRPAPGTVTRAELPAGPGVRVDTYLYAGAQVSPFYDSLVAKVVTHAVTRQAALDLMAGALARMAVEGVATNLELARRLVASAELRAGGVDTGWLARLLDAGPDEGAAA